MTGFVVSVPATLIATISTIRRLPERLKLSTKSKQLVREGGMERGRERGGGREREGEGGEKREGERERERHTQLDHMYSRAQINVYVHEQVAQYCICTLCLSPRQPIYEAIQKDEEVQKLKTALETTMDRTAHRLTEEYPQSWSR